MEDPDSGVEKTTTLRCRASEETAAYIEHLKEQWGCEHNSEALRILIHSYIGIHHGEIAGTLDPDRLQDEWGDFGTVLAASLNDDSPTPAGLDGARLGDVFDDVPVLLGAAREEAHIQPPDEPEGATAHE